MRVINTLALMLFVAVLGLATLQLRDFFREAETESELSSAQRESVSDDWLEPAPIAGNTRTGAVEPDHPKSLVPGSPAAATAKLSVGSMRAPDIQLARIAELEKQPVNTALTELLPMLEHADTAVRVAALEAFGDMTTPGMLPVLSTVLNDPDSQVRIAALEALASYDDTSAVSIIEPVLYDQNRDVRVAAIEALADLESETAVHALAGLLSDRDSQIQHQAVYALSEIGGENAKMYLLQAPIQMCCP